ncbi:hypothetical protein G3V96_22865 [Escherichia coli]|nr:hypothetical protein [Escherichia coli]
MNPPERFPWESDDSFRKRLDVYLRYCNEQAQPYGVFDGEMPPDLERARKQIAQENNISLEELDRKYIISARTCVRTGRKEGFAKPKHPEEQQ